MATVIIRYWAAAREAAGVESEQVEAETLADVLAGVRERYGDGSRLATVLGHSSFLVDGTPVGHRDPAAVPLAAGSHVEVLPPFAGG